MGTVSPKNDYVLAWRADDSIPAPHNQKPYRLSEYVQSLEDLLRAGDSGPEDLVRLQIKMGIQTPGRNQSRDPVQIEDLPPVAPPLPRHHYQP